MPRLSASITTKYTRNGERVFADDKGRLWSAVPTDGAIVFTCISDDRQSGRAIAVDLAKLDDSTGDDTLRAWLTAAPRIGMLP